MNALQLAYAQGASDALEKLAYRSWKAYADAGLRAATAAGVKMDPALHRHISSLEGPVVSIPGFAAAARGGSPMTLKRFQARIDAAAGQGRSIGSQQAANAAALDSHAQAVAAHPGQVAQARADAGLGARIRAKLPSFLGGRQIPVPAAPTAPVLTDYATMRANAQAAHPIQDRFDRPSPGAPPTRKAPKDFVQNDVKANAPTIHSPAVRPAPYAPPAPPAPPPAHAYGVLPAGHPAGPPQGAQAGAGTGLSGFIGRNPLMAAGLAAGGGYALHSMMSDDQQPRRM